MKLALMGRFGRTKSTCELYRSAARVPNLLLTSRPGMKPNGDGPRRSPRPAKCAKAASFWFGFVLAEEDRNVTAGQAGSEPQNLAAFAALAALALKSADAKTSVLG